MGAIRIATRMAVNTAWNLRRISTIYHFERIFCDVARAVTNVHSYGINKVVVVVFVLVSDLFPRKSNIGLRKRFNVELRTCIWIEQSIFKLTRAV